MESFVPPYPKPHRSKLSRLARFGVGWGSWIHTLYEKSYRMKMGEVKLPGMHFFLPNEVGLVNRVMDNPKEFPKHQFLHEILEPLIGDSVFSINGEAWKHARAMVNPAFAHTHITKVFATMDGAALELVERIRTRDLSRPLLIDPFMTHVTADIIFRTILSDKLSEEEALRIYGAFERYQKYVQPSMILRSYGLPVGYYKRKLLKAAKEIHDVFTPPIKARHAAFHAGEEGPDDILKTLMEAKHPVTGAPFTYKELVDQVAIIFLAGHETSASALTWALYLLASCPHIQEAVRQEAAASAMGEVASIRQLERTKDVFRETMRLYPPVSFLMRQVAEPMEMRGKPLKPDDLLVVSPWLVQRNEDNFPCPHAFQPERFTDPAQQEACRHAYLPFGKGPRICIGAGFAQQEAVLILARMVEAFELSVPEGEKPEPVYRLTLRPKHGIRLTLKARHPIAH